MLLLRLLRFLYFSCLSQASVAQQPGTVNASEVQSSCPVTKPSDQPFAPPSQAKAPEGTFWFGTDELCTMLPTSGKWNGLPHYTPNDSRFRKKIAWWGVGYGWHAEPHPALTITGKRTLVGQVSNAFINGQSAMMSGVFIPTLGCWEDTGDYEGSKLTFVV